MMSFGRHCLVLFATLRHPVAVRERPGARCGLAAHAHTHRRETHAELDLPRTFSPQARPRFAAQCAGTRCCRETALPRAAGPKPVCVATAAAAPAPGRLERDLAQARALPRRSSVAAPAASLQPRRCCALGGRPRRAGARRAAPGPKEPAWPASPAAPCARRAQRRRRHTSQPQAAAAARAPPRGSAAPRREACRFAQHAAIAVSRRWRTGVAPRTGWERRSVARNGRNFHVQRHFRPVAIRTLPRVVSDVSSAACTWRRSPRRAPPACQVGSHGKHCARACRVPRSGPWRRAHAP